MDFATIRLTIRRKLENGVLPTENAARVLGRSASGEACDGCGLVIRTGQLAIGGFARQPGGKAALPPPALLRDLDAGARVAAAGARAERRSAAVSATAAGVAGAQPFVRSSAGPPRLERLRAVLMRPTCEKA